jgi:8-oxo-dGTP pyrophosphatase MutT (NUDIX family)
MNDSTHNPWKIISQKPVYDNPWINVTEYDVINPSGGKGIYGKVHFKNLAIGIIPLDKSLNTWLVGQYRFTLNQYSWEIPEGGGLLNHDPLDSAKRELLEETGLVANQWDLLLKMHLSNSVTDELAIVFLARQLEQHNPEPEETEQLIIKKLPFDEVYEMVEEGTITDSITVAAILRIKLLMLNGQISA